MYYIQNHTSSLKNVLEELARKYGKEFNGDVDAFVEASKYASTNGGVDKYLEQVFDITNGGEQPPIPTPVIDVDDITGVSADGVTNATITVTITDGDGWDIAVTTDGTIVTAASINDSTLVYTVAMNSSTERSGSITITLSRSGQENVVKTVSVTQDAYVAPTVTIGPVSEVPAAGGTFSTTLTITNGDGWTKVIQRDANVITSASISGSTLTYTIGENTAYNTRSTTLSVVLMKANRTQVSDSVSITQQAAAVDTPLQWIKFTQGGYVNTGVPFEPGDRVYFKFDISESIDCMLFGAGKYVDGSVKDNLAVYINKYKELQVGSRRSGQSTATGFIVGTKSSELDTVYELDFNFNSSNINSYTINNSTGWISTFNSSNIPNANTGESLYLNTYDIGGMTMNQFNPSVRKTNSMTIYEFKLTDENGVVKRDIVPVLVYGAPKFKDTVSGTYIEVSADSGYTPVITYA